MPDASVATRLIRYISRVYRRCWILWPPFVRVEYIPLTKGWFTRDTHTKMKEKRDESEKFPICGGHHYLDSFSFSTRQTIAVCILRVLNACDKQEKSKVKLILRQFSRVILQLIQFVAQIASTTWEYSHRNQRQEKGKKRLTYLFDATCWRTEFSMVSRRSSLPAFLCKSWENSIRLRRAV